MTRKGHQVRMRTMAVCVNAIDPMSKGGSMKYQLTIKPAIAPGERHKIEDALKGIGYYVSGGGTCADGSECDITFEEIGALLLPIERNEYEQNSR